MRKIFLFFAAILCAMSAGAAQVTPNGKYFYFKTSSTWNVDNPRYSVYFAWRNGGGEDKTWASCKTVPGTTDILYVTAPGEFWDIYFCRMNGSTTDNKDANVWNKTDKLQYDGSKNFWTKSTGWNGTTSYSTYVPAVSSVTLSDNGTSIISGTGTQADPYLVYAETTIKVKGAGTKVLDDPDAKLNYNFKQGTTSKQEGTSATYQFTASATADTEYTINLDGYTKVNTTKSTVTKSATALYYKTVERAEETNTVTISYKCGDKDVQTGITEVVGVSTTSSFTAPTNIIGYQFTNWTIGAGIDLKAGTATDATITVVTKSASSDYTLVANYEEVMETVYFINANKWERVNIYKWGGNAEDSSWPGEQLTASGEQIGERDVYAYTAKQGDYANVIFNSKTSPSDGGNDQTGDLTWADGVNKYYIYNYNGNTGWYTQSDAEELLVVPVVYETVYFVNNKNWSLVQIHAWNGSSNNGWPGQALTATGEKVEGFDVYSFNAAQGTYTNLIFNNKEGDAGEQSENYVWTADKYYYMGADSAYAGGTKEEVAALVAPDPLATDVYLVGAMNGWSTTANEFRKATEDATTASVTVALSATTTDTCEFKLFIGGEWKGNNGTMQRGGVAVHESGWSFEEDGNCKIVADIAGDYTFTWDLTTKKLTVTYPELPKYTVTATSENGTIEGIENEGVYTQGDEVTLTATAAEGYHFVKWDDESTDNPRIITVTENVTLQAIFEINNYTITASTTREKLTQTIAIDGDNADWANIPMLSEPGVGPMVKMIVPQEGATLPEGAAYALMIAGDEEHVKAGYPKIFTDADKDNTTPSAAWFSPNMGFDYELATWSTGSKYAANTAGTIREMCIMQAAYNKDGFGFDGSVWGVLYFSTPSDYFIPAATTSSWKSTYRPFIVEPTQYVYNPLAGTHAAADVYATHAALPKGESFKMFNNSGDTAFWAAWTVELSQPAIYNVATSWTTDNGSSVDLYLIDAKTNTIVATFEGGWNSTATGVEEYGEWDLTNVPTGKYVLKMKNHVSWSNMVFNAVTLTPQDDVVIANTVTGSGNYNHGAEVTLTATPATGYEFVEWSDGETANPYTFTASEEVNLTATFQKKSYTVTIVKEATNQTIAIDGNNSDWAKIPMLSEPGVSPMVKMIVPQEGVSLPDGAAFALMVQGEEVYTNGNYPKTYVDADHNKETALWSSSHYSPNFGMDYEMATWSSDSKYAQNDELKVTEMCIMQVAYDKDGFGFDGNLSAVLKYKINENDYFIPNGYKSEWESTYRPFIVEPTQYVYNPLAGTHAAKDAYATHVALPKGESFNMGLSGTSYDTAFWAGWTVNLTQPVIYNVSMNMVSSGSSNMHLHLVDVATNQTVAHFISDKVYPDGETACGTWDLTAVPAGKYILKLKNQKPWSDVVFTSVTLTPQESNVEIESAEHILTGDGTYLYGEVATLNATPAIGYNFVNWSNGKTANPYSFIVTEDVEIAANFQKKIYTVAATAENGTVTGLVESGKYEHGATATLTATANEHYVFVNWTKGEEVVAETAEYTFTVEADVELVANFKLDSHTVAATAVNGTVTGAGTYEHGATATLTATPAFDYQFVKWSNESTENPLTITVTEDVTISAIFQEVIPVITHTVTWYTAVGETTEVTLEEGATITKPATDPEMEGYVFKGWTDECFVAEDGSDFTAIEEFGTADADKEYYAVFAVETTTGGGGDEIIEKSYTFSGYDAGTQYAENETHQLDDDVTIYTTQCHFTTQLRIYSSSTHDGYVISNQLPGNIISMSFNMGNKIDNLAVYGSTDGSTWTEVGKVATTSESYKDYEISFGSTNYTYFKLDVAGSNQIRIAKMGIIYATAVAGEPTTTYSNYMTTCTPEEYTIEWSVNGKVAYTTTVVEGDALVLPEAPAAPDACSEKVFMGWATTATVNADGSAITWVNDTIVPESDNTYYAVFATKTVDEENSKAGSVTLAYKGSTTTNMTVDGNNAATVGLNAEEWSVTAAKGGNSNAPGLNKDGSIRLYYAASGSNTITVTSTVEGLTIDSITITYTNDNNNGKVLVNGETINGTDGTYTINANSFVITNGNTSNVQVHIKSIVIKYAKPAVNYSDYATTCKIPEYTVTFDYSVDAGYITVNDVRISEKEVKYAEGTELTVKALTFNNYRFDAWTDEEGNELTTTPEYTFTVTGDVVLKASIAYVSGAVGTGVENNNVVSSKTMKVIQNGRLMIIREGKTYNAQGQMIE